LEFAEISICKKKSQSNESLHITIEELRWGIKAMKNGKSSGPGRIASELVKCGGDYLDRYLLQLIAV